MKTNLIPQKKKDYFRRSLIKKIYIFREKLIPNPKKNTNFQQKPNAVKNGTPAFNTSYNFPCQ